MFKICQWLPCPLAIWAFTSDGNLVKSICGKSVIYMDKLTGGRTSTVFDLLKIQDAWKKLESLKVVPPGVHFNNTFCF